MKMLLSGKQGYGVKTMTDRERVYNLVNKVCEYATWALELKQENSELKQRVAELEKPKKKRKFRAMTCSEFCKKFSFCGECPEYDKYKNACCAPYIKDNDLHRTQDGKYILIEVKE